MNKHLHDDNTGRIFYENIEPMSMEPDEHVWENITQQLDRDEALLYKRKFIIAKRMSALLLLLLISLGTCTLFYFGDKKNAETYKNLNAGNKPEDSRQKTGSKDISVQKNITEPFNENKTVQNRNTNASSVDNNEQQFYISDFLSKNAFKKQSFSQHVLPDYQQLSTVTDISPLNEEKKDMSLHNQPMDILAADNNSIVSQKGKENTNLLNQNNSNSSTAKKVNIQTQKKSPFSLTILATPEVAGYRLRDDEDAPHDNRQLIENREKQDLSFSLSLLMNYSINPHLSIQSGISFSKSYINISPSKIYAEKTTDGDVKYRYNTSTGYGYVLPSFSNSPEPGDSIVSISADQTLDYINMPFQLKYGFSKNKWSFIAGAGVEVNFLTKAFLTTDLIQATNTEKEIVTKLNGVKKTNFRIIIQPELQYQLSKKMAFTVAPVFRSAFTPINKGNIVKTYPYNFGVGAGLVYKF